MATLYVSTRKGLFTLTRGASGWGIADVKFLGDPVATALPLADGGLLAALDLGHFGVKMHRRSKDGAWTELPAPTYPPQPEADPSDERPAVKWSLERVWILEQGGDGAVWAGTLPGGLFRSDDAGETWALNMALWNRPERRQWFGGGNVLPAMHSVSIDPRDPKSLTVAISCGGVWHTDDAGATWALRTEGMFADYMPPEQRTASAIQDPHRLVACAADPDTLWVQHHNGIFHSTDRGKRWRYLDPAPSAFGFAVAVHPKDPKTAWFVPAVKDECRVPVEGAVVVNRTRDGGETFETLRSGLPQAHAYDLTYRHALDVDDTGDVLAFGSTTGGLWITENGGDDWQLVSAHLPPIYAVRFGA